MKRIRWTLLLLALGIALPAGLIVQRAIASLELESAVRHEAVAERILDEMERSLSAFLLREESRPPADYAPSSENARLRRGSFENADEPFIVGWFSLDARGNARTLTVDADGESRIASAIRDVLSPRSPAPNRETAAGENGPAAGRTQSLGTRSLSKDRAGKAQLAAPLDEEELVESNAYDVLQSLNRAQRLRSERQEKTLRKSSSLPSAKKTESEMLLAQPSAAPSLERMSAPAQEVKLADEDDLDERAGPNVDPLIGRPTGTGDIVLTRSIWRGPDVERQGLVLDRAALVAWLEMQVLAESGLSSRVDIQFGERDLLDAKADVPHRYRHRFAEPFDALVAQLDLEDLPGLGGERPIYALALLLTVVAAIGLFAVDRMTRVVVDYARRRSDFVAAVSHELKTPLTSIRMYGEMLRDGLVSSDEKRSEYYTTITDESERLSRLIDNVLDFSRLEQNQRALSLVVGSLSEAIRDAAEKLRTHVEREGFRLKLDLDDSIPTVQFDRDSVTQLVFNLVDNALKYARHAETRDIEVGLHLESGRIELCVRDHGPGIPDDQLRRVFEPFYRVGEELTRTTEGTGIGLALVKELAESMGAVVRGRNATGGGFEVRIAFAAAS
jgi:signal transduction histidine kinase